MSDIKALREAIEILEHMTFSGGQSTRPIAYGHLSLVLDAARQVEAAQSAPLVEVFAEARAAHDRVHRWAFGSIAELNYRHDVLREVETMRKALDALEAAQSADVVREAKAEAWDEGFDAGERDVMEHERGSYDNACIANPYRTEGESR